MRRSILIIFLFYSILAMDQSVTFAPLRWVDAGVYPGVDSCAKMSAADQSVADGTPAVILASSSLANGSCASTVTLRKQHKLRFMGTDTYNIVIRLPDSLGDTSGVSGVECPQGATLKLPAGKDTDLISDTNYSTLNGSGNQFGTWRTSIKGCVIDGNAGGNSAGNGIRIYGRAFLIQDVKIQNAHDAGLVTNGRQAAFTTQTGDLEPQIVNLTIINSGGNGWTHLGPNDGQFSQVVIWGSGGWGLDNEYNGHWHGLNTYLNATGGCKVSSSGASMIGEDISCTNAAGWGLFVDSGTGQVILSDATLACNGCIGVELKTYNHVISGQIANSLIGVKFNGGSATMTLSMTSNTTWFDCTSINGHPIVIVSSLDGGGSVWDAGTCGSATVAPTQGTWLMNAAALSGGSQTAFPSAGIYTAGSLQTFPGSSGTVAQTNLASQNWTANQVMANDKGWQWKNSTGTAGVMQYVNSSNNLVLGDATDILGTNAAQFFFHGGILWEATNSGFLLNDKPLLWASDGGASIGASSASRPAHVYVTTSVQVGASSSWTVGAGAPAGGAGQCAGGSLYSDTMNGAVYGCKATTWVNLTP